MITSSLDSLPHPEVSYIEHTCVSLGLTQLCSV